jgi:hypothetical protein
MPRRGNRAHDRRRTGPRPGGAPDQRHQWRALVHRQVCKTWEGGGTVDGPQPGTINWKPDMYRGMGGAHTRF